MCNNVYDEVTCFEVYGFTKKTQQSEYLDNKTN